MRNEYTVLSTLYRSAAVAVLLCLEPGVAAQERSREFESRATRGLTFTPSVSVGGGWDSNVAVAADQALGRQTERDTLFTLEPQGLLEFRDNRTEFIGGYRGFVRRYLDVEDLNGFDQRIFVSLQRMASKRVTVFVRDEYADVATTDDPPDGVASRHERISRSSSSAPRSITGLSWCTSPITSAASARSRADTACAG